MLPKSKQDRRKVPIPAILRDRLLEYLMDGPQTGRIFIGSHDSYDRGRAAARAAGVDEPTLHECRHGYASLMIAAGVNIKAISTYMGHGNIRITLDQYGRLLPGAEDEAAELLDVASAAGRRHEPRPDCSANRSAPRESPVGAGVCRDVPHLNQRA